MLHCAPIFNMTVNNITPAPGPARRAGARRRAAGILILLLGLGGAGLVYWTGAPPADLSDDVATPRTSKRAARAIEVNFGKAGLIMSDLMEDWQDPAIKAATIAATSILAASGCFYFAGLLARGDESDDSAV